MLINNGLSEPTYSTGNIFELSVVAPCGSQCKNLIHYFIQKKAYYSLMKKNDQI